MNLSSSSFFPSPGLLLLSNCLREKIMKMVKLKLMMMS